MYEANETANRMQVGHLRGIGPCAVSQEMGHRFKSWEKSLKGCVPTHGADDDVDHHVDRHGDIGVPDTSLTRGRGGVRGESGWFYGHDLMKPGMGIYVPRVVGDFRT